MKSNPSHIVIQCHAHIYGKMGRVKTTIEIPDALFRKAKAAAAEQGQSLKDFFTEAVRNRLQRDESGGPGKSWGKLSQASGTFTERTRESTGSSPRSSKRSRKNNGANAGYERAFGTR